MSWTDERIDELRKLWAEGLSASQIATRLGGVTRNAVIGKIHRLGLSGRVKTPKPRPAAPRRPSSARSAAPIKSPPRVMAVGSAAVKVVERDAPAPELEPAVLVQPVAEIVPFGGGVSLLELTPSSCRWPVGDPADEDLKFCGAQCAQGDVYCRGHAEVAFPGRKTPRAKKR